MTHPIPPGTRDILPDEMARGDWTLTATVGASRASATVAVQDYRKPEFRVEVTPDREVYVSGDEVRFVMAASYFFGAPVFGAQVRYNLFESRLRSDDEGDGEDGDFEAPVGGGYGRVLKTGETRTDVDGRVALTFTPERVAYDRRLTLEVEVVDGASRVVSGRGATIMGRGLFTIALRPSRRVIGVGDPVVVPEGMPMPNYHSKTLNRDFDLVYFVDSIMVGGATAAAGEAPGAGKMPEGHPPLTVQSAAQNGVDVSGIKKVEGGQTVADVFAGKAKLSGQEVKVRGKVVKFSPGIMGKNWIHLQDGTGQAGTNDLTVTTSGTAKVGDTVVVAGKVSTDKDFGYGYKYEVILEDANVTVE